MRNEFCFFLASILLFFFKLHKYGGDISKKDAITYLLGYTFVFHINNDAFIRYRATRKGYKTANQKENKLHFAFFFRSSLET